MTRRPYCDLHWLLPGALLLFRLLTTSRKLADEQALIFLKPSP